jgi:hypothetical protein
VVRAVWLFAQSCGPPRTIGPTRGNSFAIHSDRLTPLPGLKLRSDGCALAFSEAERLRHSATAVRPASSNFDWVPFYRHDRAPSRLRRFKKTAKASAWGRGLSSGVALRRLRSKKSLLQPPQNAVPPMTSENFKQIEGTPINMSTATDDELRPSDQIDLWPYSSGSGILDRKLAASIRAWALSSGGMTEPQLRGLSQRQALRAYIEQCLRPAIAKVMDRKVEQGFLRKRTPEEAEALARAALRRGDLFGLPLDPAAALERACPHEQDRRAAVDYIQSQPTPQEQQEAARRVLNGEWTPPPPSAKRKRKAEGVASSSPSSKRRGVRRG